MMTTDTAREVRARGARVLVGSIGLVLVCGLLVTAVGFATSGVAAGVGALVGAVVTVLVLALGVMVVETVAVAQPSASLIVALLTYVLQVVALAALLVLARESGVAAGSIDLRWAGGAAIASALAWTAAQVWLATRARIPAYDLDLPASAGGPEGSAR